MKRIFATIVAAAGLAVGASAETVIDLKDVSKDTTIENDTKIKGTLSNNCKISIAAGARVTLANAKITSVSGAWAGLTCKGDATIALQGENKIYACGDDYPGIYVPKGKTLTIAGGGCLYAYGKESGAGIGGSSTKNCGNIVIAGGEIHAASGETRLSGGSVTVEGGNVHIVAPVSCLSAAGIGGGYQKSCGNITIKGGRIYADGGESGAGIGSGPSGSCGAIKITGGSIEAVSCMKEAIGGDNCGTVTIGNGIAKIDAITGRYTTQFDEHIAMSRDDVNVRLTVQGPYKGYGKKSDTIDLGWRTVRITSYLGGLNGSKTIKDGDWVTGELTGNYKISIAAGATVVLENANIDSLLSAMPGITCLGSATIIIQGDNRVIGCGDEYPGIFVPQNCNLDIKSVVPGSAPGKIGSLMAVSGGERGAAIGACWYDLDVDESNAYAKPCGRVRIYGGRINAIGGTRAAALGGRFLPRKNSSTVTRHGKRAEIYGGTVWTDGGVPMSGPKFNFYSNNVGVEFVVPSDIEDSDNVVLSPSITEVPQGGNEQMFRWSGDLHKLHPDTGYVEAYDETRVWGSARYEVKMSIVPDARVTLNNMVLRRPGTAITNSDGSVTWCRGDYAGITCEGDATIILETDSKNAISLEMPDSPDYDFEDNGYYPAIYVPKNHTLTFDGDGELMVIGGEKAAGIGAGYGSKRDCGKIVIKNGVIMAIGGRYASGIGGGYGGTCQGLTILGGLTQAVGGRHDSHEAIEIPGSSLEIAENLERKDAKVSRLRPVCSYVGTQSYPDRFAFWFPFWESVSHGLFVNIYNDQWCCLVGTSEDLSKYNRIGGGSTMMSSALHGTGARLFGGTGGWDGVLSTIGKHYCDAIAGDGFVLTGTLTSRHKIAIAAGATVTLKDLKIVGGHDDSSPYAGLTCLGSATLILEGENEVTSFHGRYPGVYVPTNSTLVIAGKGSLRASADGPAAGIGGGYMLNCGRIVVSNGVVEAYGGDGAAGIGAGAEASCPYVSICSGITRVKASGGRSDGKHIYPLDGSISRILGSTTADGVQTIQWNGDLGQFYAVNGDEFEVTAFDGTTISHSTWSSSINSDKKVKVMIAPGAHVTLSGATINQTGAMGDDCPWAGITCLGNATITLVGLNQVTSYHAEHPGIFVPKGSTLTIEGNGSLNASANNSGNVRGYGAGIGGGYMLDSGTIAVSGGIVTAVGVGGGAGIGGGYKARCDGVRVNAGISSVTAECQGGYAASPVGSGGEGSCGFVRIDSRVSAEDENNGLRKVFHPGSVDLSEVAASPDDYPIYSGTTVTGTLGVNRKLVIADGAEVTLCDVTINGGSNYNYVFAGITCLGNATIRLAGANTVKGFYKTQPGIYVPAGKTLTIKGEGSLRVGSLDSWAAGIGGSSVTEGPLACGNIVIEGGSIFAYSGSSAGIGAGSYGNNCGYITISGGTVVAEGGYAGIGASYQSNCGNITITGGTVTATGHGNAAGIGGAQEGNCGTITIGPDVIQVIATGSSGAADPIGAGYNATCGIVSVHDSLLNTLSGTTRTITVNPVINLALAMYSSMAEKTIEDGFTLSGTFGGTGKLCIADGATVTLRNVTINGSSNANNQWAGITCLGDATIILEGTNVVRGFHQNYPGIYIPEFCTLTIKGSGVLDASSSGYGAGIGAGYINKACGDIVIESGTIIATGGTNGGAAGIGGAYGSGCGDITISGGFVTANGGAAAAGIGCGYENACGKITVESGVKRVVATGGADVSGSGTGEPIGASVSGHQPKGVMVAGGLIDITDEEAPATRTIMNKQLDLGTVTSNMTLYDGMTASGTLNGPYKISIADGAHVTLNQARIEGENDSSYPWAGLTCLGDATITLRNTSRIRGFYDWYPGIYVPVGSTLTIDGNGSLYAYSGGSSDGWAAGIGSGFDTMSCGNIVINGGYISAWGGEYSAGIGGTRASCGDITINGGTIYAHGGPWGSGIGGGFASTCGTITIGSGITRVSATTNESDTNEPIGKGRDNPYGDMAQCEGVVIDPILVDTTTDGGLTRTLVAPTIVDLSTLTGDVTLNDLTIATGTLGGAYKVSIAAGAKVWLRDADINGSGTLKKSCAGLTCLGDAMIVLEGSNTVTSLNNYFAGIYVPVGYTLTITGEGSLYAAAMRDSSTVTSGSGSTFGAGIGGCGGTASFNSSCRHCGNIVFAGGTVVAVAGFNSSAIGSSYDNDCGDITFEAGIVSVKALFGGIGKTYPSGTEGTITVAPELERTGNYICHPWDGNLDTLNRDATAKDGTIISGSNSGAYTVHIEAGAEVELDNATVPGTLTCDGDATIVLVGDNNSRIAVANGHTLTITGDGSLLAEGGDEWSGTPGISGGNIVIESGSIVATGGGQARGAAAIGNVYTAFDSDEACGDITIGPGVTKVVASVTKVTLYENATGQPIGHGGGKAKCGTITVDTSVLTDTTSEDDYTITRTIVRDAGKVATAAIQEWATANGASISGAWNARDAKGVANAFRYVFDKAADADFDENKIIIDFETDGEGRVAIQTLPVVNGQGLFSLTIIASDNVDGTGYVMEYPLTPDEDGVTIIDEEYNPSRFFRVRIDVQQ